MKRINFLLMSFLFLGYLGNSQVKDITLTFTPAAEYTWWDNNSGLNDGFLVGGKLGFGFGEFVELRGIYLQSLNLTTNIENFGLETYNPGLYSVQNISLTRWGGEFKANIGRGKFKPYVTLGTGIQSFDIPEMNKLEQIYASAGLGVKLNLFSRAVFLLEAKNTTYSFNAGADLLTSNDKANLGYTDADFNRERLSNWAIQGALQFYLGGRKPGEMTELDKAYLEQFSGGLSGIQPIIELGTGYVSFNTNSLFRDTWMIGGYAGLDFNKYIGLRGFYFHSTSSMNINAEFDHLSMYGLEFRANLNDGMGITPYISLGGGYLNPDKYYLGKTGIGVNGGEFASGGLGLNIPLGKRVLITGGARGILMSGEKLLDISVVNDIQTHVMYDAGIKFTLGKKSKSPEKVYQNTLNMEVEKQMAENNLKIQQMKSDYLAREKELQKELQLAYDFKDVDKAVELMEEKNEVQASLKEIEKLEGIQVDKQKSYSDTIADTALQNTKGQNVIQMTPAEFESLIIRILEATSANRDTTIKSAPVKVDEQAKEPVNQQQQIDLLNNRIEELEKLLKDINEKDEVDKASDTSTRILEELEALNKKVDANASVSAAQENPAQPVVVVPIDATQEEFTTSEPLFKYSNSSVLAGVNIGGETTANFGLRLHFGIYKSALEFMPEAYVGFGETNSYGFSFNLILPIMKTNEKIRPYVGAGFGGATINNNYHGNYNVLLGVTIPFITENLSIDYTMRNSFNYNQLAVSYRLPF